MNLADFSTYISLLMHQINTHRGVRGYHGALAKAAGCQQSYLSRVLKEEVHLTPEHALGLTQFWNFTPIETDYYLGLVNLSRAGTKALKQFHAVKLAELQKKMSEVASQLSPRASEGRELVYYSSWHMTALHVLVSVPKFNNAEALAKHLGLSVEFVVSCLTKLKNLGIVRQDGKLWQAESAHLHAPRGSIFHWLHLSNWRQRALLNAQEENDSLHYTGIHSLSRADAQSLQLSLLKFIRDSNASIAQSPEELAVCVNIDFFEI